jgi:hypothetical protein
VPRQTFSNWNYELFRSELLRQLWIARGWLIAGALLQLALALYFIFLSPFSLAREFDDMLLAARALASLNLLFGLGWILSQWLAPQRAVDAALDTLPLAPLQRQIMVWLPLRLLPIALSLLAVVVWFILQLYFGNPYNSGSAVQDYLITDGPEGWRELGNPWWPRVLATGLSILGAGLTLPAFAIMLEQSIRPAFLRVILLLTGLSAFGLLLHSRGYEYISMCYRQTRGHSIWPYLALGIILLAIPVLLGLLRPSQRSWLLGALLIACVVIASLPFLESTLTLPGVSAALRDALGDSRYSLAWYFGHLDYWQNSDWLLNRWTSSLLLGSPAQPLRLPMWIGAALLPIIYALWIPGGYLLGMAISRRRVDRE